VEHNDEVVQQFEKRLAEIKDEVGKGLKDLKDAVTAEFEQKLQKGFADPETRERVDKLYRHVDELDARLTAPRPSAAIEVKTLGDRLVESKEYRDWAAGSFSAHKNRRFAYDGLIGQQKPFHPIFGPIERKLISDTALGNPGSAGDVLVPQRLPGVIQLPRQSLRIRDLLRVQPTAAASVDWLKQNTVTRAASPQVEGEAKAESTVTYTTASTPVRTIAHFIQVTTQALADAEWLRSDLDSELMYGLKLKEETEILKGDGLGSHINGILSQASAYAGTYDAAGDTILDKLRHAILEARLALYPVDGIVLNPKDVHDIELLKVDMGGGANTGPYQVGNARTGEQILTVWGRPVIESDSIDPGDFLVGAFGLGAILFDRLLAVIDISFEHGTNFTENEATIRAEERIALAVTRPAAFVTGSF
jgi:HK97 family phage major capsid protein